MQIFLAGLPIISHSITKLSPITSDLVGGLALILVFSMMLGLTIFQTYLMAANLTTWEIAKWDKIDYLNKNSRSKGSPFSNGVTRNTIDYWVLGFRSSRKIW